MYQMKSYLSILITVIFLGCTNLSKADYTVKIDDNKRAEQIKEMKWGMFICWSFSTFSGQEWTPTLDKDVGYFRATGVDTDQWCKVA
jgi:alpha-L-fucosidase